jgi:diacylglycerol kinase family enzyme
MYQATGSRRSCANTATPRPHRLPVHSAHPAAITPAPMTEYQAAVPYPLIAFSWAPPMARTTRTTATTTSAAPSSATTTPAWRTVAGAGTITTASVSVPVGRPWIGLVPVRAVLIVNPNATSTTPAGRDLLAHALESRVSLTVAHTDHRGHAIEIASDAARDGIDVVIVHGGDGTVNEVVNGILGDCGQGQPAGEGPAVGVVPGGAANVFARALGISPDPTEATNQLVDLLDEHRRGRAWRRIGLMDCGERWAVFTAGMGVDGAVVAAVEAQRDKGRKVTASRYIRIAVREMLAGARREPELTLHLPGHDPVSGVHFAFVSNSSPWTYANTRPIWTNPETTFETGVGVFAITSMNVWANLGLVRRMWSRKPQIEAKHLIRDDDLAWVRVTSDTEVACQIDGDYAGLRETMTFTSVPNALGVVAPPAKTL